MGALWQTLAIVCSSAAGRNFGCLGAKTRPGGAFFGFEPGRCRFLLLLLCSLGGFAIRESILGLMKTALSRGKERSKAFAHACSTEAFVLHEPVGKFAVSLEGVSDRLDSAMKARGGLLLLLIAAIRALYSS